MLYIITQEASKAMEEKFQFEKNVFQSCDTSYPLSLQHFELKHMGSQNYEIRLSKRTRYINLLIGQNSSQMF